MKRINPGYINDENRDNTINLIVKKLNEIIDNYAISLNNLRNEVREVGNDLGSSIGAPGSPGTNGTDGTNGADAPAIRFFNNDGFIDIIETDNATREINLTQTLKNLLDFAPIWQMGFTTNDSSGTVTAESRNILTGDTFDVSANVPSANSTNAGLLSSADWNGLQEAYSDIQELFDQSWLVISDTAISNETDATNAWTTSTGSQPREGVSVIDNTNGNLWRFGKLNGVDTWVQISGGTTASAFDNYSLGLIKGNPVDGGIVPASNLNDGTASVQGWGGVAKQTDLQNYLPLAGGTVTGNLILDDGTTHNASNLALGGNLYVNTGSIGNPANQEVLVIENDNFSWMGRIRPMSGGSGGVLYVDGVGNTTAIAGSTSQVLLGNGALRNIRGSSSSLLFDLFPNATNNNYLGSGDVLAVIGNGFTLSGYLRPGNPATTMLGAGVVESNFNGGVPMWDNQNCLSGAFRLRSMRPTAYSFGMMAVNWGPSNTETFMAWAPVSEVRQTLVMPSTANSFYANINGSLGTLYFSA